AEHQLLGDTAAEALDDLAFEVSARIEVHVVVGCEMRDAHGAAARLDRDLVQSVLRTRERTGDGVAGLVPGDDPPLAVRRAKPDALLAEQHAVASDLDVGPLDLLRAH